MSNAQYISYNQTHSLDLTYFYDINDHGTIHILNYKVRAEQRERVCCCWLDLQQMHLWGKRITPNPSEKKNTKWCINLTNVAIKSKKQNEFHAESDDSSPKKK